MPSTASQGLLSSIYQAQDWLKTRLANIDIFDEHYQNEAKTNPFYALGPIFYLVWFIVMLSGLILIIWYIPTKASAFDSILKIQHQIPFGGLIRGLHKYGADAMIIAATMRMFRMFLAADYKPGKEFNIAIGLITLLLSMYSGLTGYLLIWNQRAFWATKVFATFPTYMDQFPGMGDFYLPLVKSLHLGWNTAEFLLGAGGAITQETITRFFSLHLAFSLIPLIFVELYFYKTGYVRIPLNWTKRSIITGMLVVVAVILPAAIGARSNPDVTPLPILSDWYFLGLYQMYKYLEPVVATEITLVIPLSVILIPFIDGWITGPEKDIMKRPLVLMTCIMAMINWVIFSFLIIFNIANIHNDPPYWRAFLFLMIDVGIVWQLALVWQNKDVQQRVKAARGAMVMGILAAIQTLSALAYYYMARTEMFLSPITQSFTYWLFKPLMGGSGEAAEAAVREAVKAKVDYWSYQELLARGGTVPAQETVTKIQEVCQQSTPLDGFFQLVPTFLKDPKYIIDHITPEMLKKAPDLAYIMDHPGQFGLTSIPDLQYHGLIDFMVSNRWCFDYVTFCDRMAGLVLSVNVVNGKPLPYPLEVPALDWFWMVGGALAMVLSFWTYAWCQKAKQAKPAAQPAAASAS